MRVEVNGLRKVFGNFTAVRDISFSFVSGQIFGFVGPNGAGKTTTMRILSSLEEPTAGDATIDGTSVVEYPEKARQLVGYVPDNLPTQRDMSVHDYLDFFARAYGLKGKKRLQMVNDIEDFTNLARIRDKALTALSKGMKQRVSVARALLHDPPVLIMDEPAAGLDPHARIELRELLKILAGQGKAILISSHILTELAEICDGVVIIEKGHIRRAGTLAQLQSQNDKETLFQTVRIRCLDRVAELHKFLLEQPHVDNATVQADNSVEVRVDGSEKTCARLLRNLVQADYPIVEFRLVRVGLEEIFMNVTKGEVA